MMSDNKVEIELELDNDVIAYIEERAVLLNKTFDEVIEDILQLVIDNKE